MVSFIHNGSEITTSENQKHKIQSNILKVTTSFLTFKQHIIRLTQGHWSCTPTHYKTAIFIAAPMKKNLFSICQFVDREVMGLVRKYYLLPGYTSQVSIFSLHKIKMSKQRELFIL